MHVERKHKETHIKHIRVSYDMGPPTWKHIRVSYHVRAATWKHIRVSSCWYGNTRAFPISHGNTFLFPRTQKTCFVQEETDVKHIACFLATGCYQTGNTCVFPSFFYHVLGNTCVFPMFLSVWFGNTCVFPSLGGATLGNTCETLVNLSFF